MDGVSPELTRQGNRESFSDQTSLVRDVGAKYANTLASLATVAGNHPDANGEVKGGYRGLFLQGGFDYAFKNGSVSQDGMSKKDSLIVKNTGLRKIVEGAVHKIEVTYTYDPEKRSFSVPVSFFYAKDSNPPIDSNTSDPKLVRNSVKVIKGYLLDIAHSAQPHG